MRLARPVGARFGDGVGLRADAADSGADGGVRGRVAGREGGRDGCSRAQVRHGRGVEGTKRVGGELAGLVIHCGGQGCKGRRQEEEWSVHCWFSEVGQWKKERRLEKERQEKQTVERM